MLNPTCRLTEQYLDIYSSETKSTSSESINTRFVVTKHATLRSLNQSQEPLLDEFNH